MSENKNICRKAVSGRRFLCFFVSHQNLGNDVQNLVMASAASGGTMGDLFDILERIENILEYLILVQSFGNIVIAYIFAFADLIIFFHNRIPHRLNICFVRKSYSTREGAA
jgi:hypothetical protein